MAGLGCPRPQPFNRAFRWLWLGQLISNLGTQCSLYGLGLWSFARQGQLIDFAAVALVVQLSKVAVLPLLGRRLSQWPRRRVLLVANGIEALCTLTLAALLLLPASASKGCCCWMGVVWGGAVVRAAGLDAAAGSVVAALAGGLSSGAGGGRHGHGVFGHGGAVSGLDDRGAGSVAPGVGDGADSAEPDADGGGPAAV